MNFSSLMMNARTAVLIALCSSLAQAEEPKLYLMLGHIEEVRITPVFGPVPEDGKVYLDHSCGKQTIRFRVSDYVTGSGETEVTFSNSLPDYACESSWDGAPISLSLAIVSKFEKYDVFRSIERLEETSHGPTLVEGMSGFMFAASIHDDIDDSKLLVDLDHPISMYWGAERRDALVDLSEEGIVRYQETKIDLNEGCIAGCEEGNFITVYEVEFLKGIPVSKIRAYGF